MKSSWFSGIIELRRQYRGKSVVLNDLTP